MFDAPLTTYAAQIAHYADVRSRTRGKPRTVDIMPKPVLALPAPAREWVSQQSAHVLAWKAAQVFANYCDVTDDVGEVKSDPDMPKRIKVGQIAHQCASHFGVSMNEIRSARRFNKIVRARQVAMYLAKELTNRSYPEIGRLMGGRDHSTCIHAVRVVAKRLETDTALLADIEAIRAKIGCSP